MASNSGNNSTGDIEMTTFQNLMQDVSKSAECPVCMDIPIPPILLCLSGHIICSYCRPRLETCGLCHMDFTEMRNYSMESVVANFKVDCRNDRCEKKLKTDELRAHMEVCEYRDVSCFENRRGACAGRKWGFDEYVQHLRVAHRLVPLELQDNGRPLAAMMSFDLRTGLKTEHVERKVCPETGMTVESTIIRLTGVTWKPCVLVFKGQTFILKATSFANGAITLWLAALLSEEKASKYRFVVQVERDGNPAEGSNFLMVNTITAHSIHAEVRPGSEACCGPSNSNGLIVPELDTVTIPSDGLVTGRDLAKEFWRLKCCIEEIENEDAEAGAGSNEAGNTSPPLSNWGLEIKLEKFRVSPNVARMVTAQGPDVENGAEQGSSNVAPRAEAGQSNLYTSFRKRVSRGLERWCTNITFVSLVGICVSFIYWFLLGGIVFDK